MTIADRLHEYITLFFPLPLVRTRSDLPAICIQLHPNGGGGPQPQFRLRPVANAGQPILTDWFLAHDGVVDAFVYLYYWDLDISRNILCLVNSPGLPCQTPIRLGLGDATPPNDVRGVPVNGLAGGRPYCLLRGSLTIPIANRQPEWNNYLSLLWPTYDPGQVRALRLEPGGIYLEGVLPDAFYPGRPNPNVEPVILRVPQHKDYDVVDQSPVWTLVNSKLGSFGGPTASEYVRGVTDQFDSFRAPDRSFIRRVETKTITDLKVRILPDPHPFDNYPIIGPDIQPTQLKWWVEGPGVRFTVATKQSATSVFEPSFFRGIAKRQHATDLWPKFRDWSFVDGEPFDGQHEIGFVDNSEGSLQLILDETVAARSLPQTSLPENAVESWFRLGTVELSKLVSSGLPTSIASKLAAIVDLEYPTGAAYLTALQSVLASSELSQWQTALVQGAVHYLRRRSWLCTDSGWLAVDSVASSFGRPPVGSPVAALSGTVDVSGIANELGGSPLFASLNVRAQALSRKELKSTVTIRLIENSQIENLKFAIGDPVVSVMTGPDWAADLGTDPALMPVLWVDKALPTDAEFSSRLTTAEFATPGSALPGDPKVLTARLCMSNQFIKSVPLTTNSVAVTGSTRFSVIDQLESGHSNYTNNDSISFRILLANSTLVTGTFAVRNASTDTVGMFMSAINSRISNVAPGQAAAAIDADGRVLIRMSDANHGVTPMQVALRNSNASRGIDWDIVTFGTSGGDISFGIDAENLTAWQQPDGLPLCRNFQQYGTSNTTDWLDVNRGLVPFGRLPNGDSASTQMTLVNGELPKFPENDCPTLDLPVGVGASSAIGAWQVQFDDSTKCYLVTLPGVEVTTNPSRQPQWAYRHANPALDEWYSAQLTNTANDSSITWDTTSIDRPGAFLLQPGSQPATGWLPVCTGDQSGRCKVEVSPASTDLRGPSPALSIKLTDEAGSVVETQFQHPTEAHPSTLVALTLPLKFSMTAVANRIPQFNVNFDMAAVVNSPTIVRNGQPLLASRRPSPSTDDSILTLDGLGTVREEPQGELSRSAVPDMATDDHGWTKSLQLPMGAGTPPNFLELVDVKSNKQTVGGAGWQLHDGNCGWPLLKGFPLFPLTVNVEDDGSEITRVVVTAVPMCSWPMEGASSPPTNSRGAITLEYQCSHHQCHLVTASGTLDWRFSPSDSPGETSLARAYVEFNGAPSNAGVWPLDVREVAIDHPIGLLRLPSGGWTASLESGKLILSGESPDDDQTFTFRIEEFDVPFDPSENIVLIHAGRLTWKSLAGSDYAWELEHSLSLPSFNQLPAWRLQSLVDMVVTGAAHSATPPQRAVWKALSVPDMAVALSGGHSARPLALLLDRLIRKAGVYSVGVWDEAHLDQATRVRITNRQDLNSEAIRHLNTALIASAFPEFLAPAAWQFRLLDENQESLVEIAVRLVPFGPRRFAFLPDESEATPPDFPAGTWFRRIARDETGYQQDLGFVVATFDNPMHIRDLGAELSLVLTDIGNSQPEDERTRLAARLVLSSKATPSGSLNPYVTNLGVQLTGQWKLTNQISYCETMAGLSVLDIRVLMFLNRAEIEPAVIFAGNGSSSDTYLFGVADYQLTDNRHAGSSWSWQAPQSLRITTLSRYTGNGTSDRLVVDGGAVLWLAPPGSGSFPGPISSRPDISVAGADLTFNSPPPDLFDQNGGREVRLPWAAGPTGPTWAPSIVLASEPPARSYPEAGAHPRLLPQPSVDRHEEPDSVDRTPTAGWLDALHLESVLWPEEIQSNPVNSRPSSPTSDIPYTDLAWLLTSNPGAFTAATVVRQHIPSQAGTMTLGRTLVVFPYQITVSIPTEGPDATSVLQLLLYDPSLLDAQGSGRTVSLFRRIAATDIPSDHMSDDSARRWGNRELLVRRLRQSGLVIQDYVCSIVVASPLSFDGPLSSTRPWDFENPQQPAPIDLSRHLPGRANISGDDCEVGLRADASMGVFPYSASTSLAVRFTEEHVDSQQKTIKIQGHGFIDGQALVFTGPWHAAQGLVSGRTYYVIAKDSNSFQLSEDRITPTGLDDPGPGAKSLTVTEATTPPFTTVRLFAVGNGSSGSIGHYRPAIGTDVNGGDHSIITLSRIDQVKFAAQSVVGFPRSAVDLNFARPTTWDQTRFFDSDIVTVNTVTGIRIPFHGFAPGDEVVYSTGGVAIGGLQSGTSYFIKTVSFDDFTLVANPNDVNPIQLGRPAAGPQYLSRRDRQFILPPQVDVCCWSSRPGELVTTQWGVSQYSKNSTSGLVKAGVAPAISLRRPRADASGSTASLKLREPLRFLGAGRFIYAAWNLIQTIESTSCPSVDRCSIVLATPRSVVQGKPSPESAEADPTAIPLYSVRFDASAVVIVQGTSEADRIVLPSHHFENGDQVVYSKGTTPIGNLTDGNCYFIASAQENTIQLANTENGSPLTLGSTGSGTHILLCRPKVDFDLIAGKGYLPRRTQPSTIRTFLIRNSKGKMPRPQLNDPLDDSLAADIQADSLGYILLELTQAPSEEKQFLPGDVDCSADVIRIPSHRYTEGMRLTYDTSGTPINGLEPKKSYYVVSATTDTFQLASSRGGSAINFLTPGVGTHTLTGDWASIGSDVYEYSDTVDVVKTTDRAPMSVTIGLYQFQLDPQTNTWTRLISPGGFLSITLVDANSIVPDAPESFSIIAYPKTDPNQIRLVGSGKIAPQKQQPCRPSAGSGSVTWQTSAAIRALFRASWSKGSTLCFGVRLTGSSGEAVPHGEDTTA